jgi:hypothetical protein
MQHEPEDVIIVGSRDLRPPTQYEQKQMQADVIKDLQWEEEDNAKQDAYLAKHGIF